MVAKNLQPVISDIYELSPMQEAMLFHSAYAPDSKAYFDQFSCVIEGELQVERFREAWQLLANRHAAFRTSFHWQDLPKPVQVVQEQVSVPWLFLDWRGLAPELQDQKWQALVEQDREELFRLERAPLMRCHLAQLSKRRYFFAWSHHHIILDGWCLSLVLGELLEIYRALRSGERPRLKPARPYRSYITWLQQQDEAQARDYWSGELSGFAAPTDLSAIMTGRGERSEMADRTEEARLSVDLARGLREMASRHQLTANTLIQGAWALLLSRYSGETDIVFGATVSGRPADLPGVEEMIGVFINTIPARVQVEPQSPLISWLKQLQSRHAARLRYSFASLSDIQQWSEVARGTNLFHSNLIFMNYPVSEEATRGAGEFEIADVRIFEQTDIGLTLQVTPGLEWSIEAVYDSKQYDAGMIARMLGHFTRLLEEFVEDCDRPLSAIPILTQAERRWIFEELNNNRVEFDAEKTIVHRLEEAAKNHPHSVAVECDGRRLTAQALNRRANQLARSLLNEASLAADDIVAILMRRSERIIESILAVWKCGAAYVPIDPDYPEQRIKEIIKSAGARIIITDRASADSSLLSELERASRVVSLDEIERLMAQQDGANLAVPIDPSSLAYVIFTSGSTGKPKGAMVEHIGMLNHILAKVHDLEIDSASVIAQSASQCFDISIWQMFAAPLAGGKTIVYRDEIVLDPDRFIERAEADGVTIMELVPSYLSVVLDRIENREANERENIFSRLRCLQVTGEAVTPALVERWFDRFPRIPVANAYGPTECSDNITHFTMHELPLAPSIPVGRPLRNFNIYIVDEHMNLCPTGIKGEICASGLGVGRGYLNDPERTAEVFLQDPFSDERGRRLYKTGDIGCYMPDGNILLFGRKDHQVKVRGFRIELGEIEVALAEVSGIRESAVLDRRDDGKEPYLCAYYTLKAGARKDSEAIIAELRRALPDYMVPALFVEMDELPLTPNGKIDRKRLPAPDLTQRPAAVDYVAPRTEAERIVAQVWSDVLGVESPGVHDNFFSLGGDSILSMQVVSRAKRAGLKLGVVDVFRHPTIAELASHATQIEPKKKEARFEAAAAYGPLPLTPAQKRFLEETTVDPHHYNQSVLIDLPAGVSADHIGEALRLILARHDSLRLRFYFAEGCWHQQVSAAPAKSPLIIEDLSRASDDERGETIRSRAERLQSSLDLSKGPLMAAALFLKGAHQPASLLLIIHHLCVDAVSWRVLLEDLLAAYRQLEQGRAVQLPEPSAAFAQWSGRLAEYARSEIRSEEKAYWLSVARAAAAPIPLDFHAERSANLVESSEELWTALDERATQALLTDLPRAYNARTDDALMAALALALADWTEDEQVLIDVESHGREPLFDELDISRTAGWLTAEFPVLLHIDKSSGDAAAHLKSIKEQLRSVPNGGLGYGLLKYYSDDTSLRESLAQAPPAQVLFNYLGQTDRAAGNHEGWKIDLDSLGAARSAKQLRDHLIEVNALAADGRIKLSFSFSRSFHRRETIEHLAHRFNRHIASIIDRCAEAQAGGFTPSDFPLSSLDQRSLDLLYESLRSSITGHPRADVVDLYALSPVQKGMLFHSLYTPESDTYFNQLNCVIRGALDAEAFREAWAAVIDHHRVLRTSFHWEGLNSPVQVVHRRAQPEWLMEDWSRHSSDALERRRQAYLRDDRRRKFDLARAPLMRFGLFRLSDQAYYFNWSHHHILLDGWSSAIVLNDVLVAYEAIVSRKPVALSARRAFRESIEWLARADTVEAERYWREKLKGFTAPTSLVLSRLELEGRARSGGYAEEELSIDAELTSRLQAIARGRGVTMNTIAQAAWALLLSRYGNEPDVVYGSIVSGRPSELEGAASMVGVFINTLPARAIIDPAKPLIDWLEELQIEQVEREQYAYSPLGDIHRWSDAPNGVPLFETILIFENYPTEEFLLQGAGGLSINEVHALEPNNYPITLVVTPGREIALKVMYDDGRFDRATVQRMLGHYEAVMRRIAESPEQASGAIDILTPSERREILRDCSGTLAPLPEDRTFIQLFEGCASSSPDHIAVQFNGQSLSYGQLNERSNQLARCLIEAGRIEAGDRIAVLMARSEKMVEAIVAIWKCRAAYVPIDPSHPLERIETILADCGAKLVISSSDIIGENEAALINSKVGLIALDRIESLRLSQSQENLPDPPAQSDLAYVIYTSGSTGKPKGVMIEHRGMLNHLLAMAAALDISPQSAVAQTASHCFDISMWQFFAALAAGGRTVIYSDETILNPALLADRLDKDGVHVAQFVPSYLSVFLDELERRRDLRSLSHLRWLVTIGEILKPDYARRWFELRPDIKMMNAYGPTEASDSVTHYVLSAPAATASIPIGRPIQNMRVYVVDHQMNLCPAGVKGEICIGGIGVGRGYMGDEERTSAAFIKDPFCNDPSARLYKTGDIGCFAPDGNLIFFGRSDHQIKIRGHRLELGEIESALVKIEGVSNAVVVSRDSNDQKILCAYVTLSTGCDKQPSDLAAALASRLPAYMIPDAIRVLDELPLTTSGKVDRKRLPSLERREARADDYAAPASETERELAGIWKEALGLELIGVNDHFTDLGGHSLNAIQIVSRIRTRLRREINFADLFESNTIRSLAARLDGLDESYESRIPHAAEREHYEASHAQKRIWLASRSREGSVAYNMAAAVWLEGALDKDALKRAFDLLIARHESLRTVFAVKQGELRQRICSVEEAPTALEQLDLRGSPHSEEKAARIVSEDRAQAFDLARGPLFKAKLIQASDSKHLLALIIHHIVGDAWSLQIIFDDLVRLYTAARRQEPMQLSPLRIQYKDYAEWHNAWLKSDAARREREFWLERLSNAGPPVCIPPDFTSREPFAFDGDSVYVTLNEDRVEDLRRIAERHKTSVYGVTLAAVYALLFRYTNREEITIGTQTAGRAHADVQEQVGCFVNTLALRQCVRGSDTVSDVVAKTSATLSCALDHQDYPFDMVLEDLRGSGGFSPDRSSLFEVQVDYVPDLKRGLLDDASSGLKITELSEGERKTKFPLSFMIGQSRGGLTVEIVYSAGLFKRDSIATLAERFARVLQAFAEDETRKIDSIELSDKPVEPNRVEIELNIPD